MPSRQVNDFFTKMKQEKIEVVARPGAFQIQEVEKAEDYIIEDERLCTFIDDDECRATFVYGYHNSTGRLQVTFKNHICKKIYSKKLAAQGEKVYNKSKIKSHLR